MSGKSKILLVVGILLLGLLYTNSKYPFVTPNVGRWSVGFSFAENSFEKPKINFQNIITYSKVDSILGKPGHYIADPFFIKVKDTFYLFVELKGEKEADIALFTSVDGETYDYGGIVLDEDFHLSYPQVFHYKDIFYMLPETSQIANVVLYEAVDFPYVWQKKDTLVKNQSLKDPTILLSKNLNLLVAVDSHMQQYMFTADSLTGSWREVKNYQQRLGNETRPGGRFFELDGNHYLPVQDRKNGYGSAISIFKVSKEHNSLKLVREKKEYLNAQENIKWFNRGMHHIDIQKVGMNYYSVYDGDYNEDGDSYFQFKRSLKFVYSDIYNLFH